MPSRKAVLRALAQRVVCYPEATGYVIVAEWREGGRAAVRVTTARRRKLYPVPEDVLAMFEAEPEKLATRSMAASS